MGITVAAHVLKIIYFPMRRSSIEIPYLVKKKYMSTAIAIVPVVPMRSEAAHRSEMVNQLLLLETGTVIESSGLFVKIRTDYDGYEGWCQKSQLLLVEQPLPVLQEEKLAPDWINMIQVNGVTMQVSKGTPLQLLVDRQLEIPPFRFSYDGDFHIPARQDFNADAIHAISKVYLNTSYLWGGRSVFGIDCSGFVQQVYRFFGKKLPRDAWQQAEQGEAIGFLEEVQCGDLAFFDNEAGRITHVGLLFDSNSIIHASGKVRIDPIDHAGIINLETGERTHRLRIIKRYTA
jgi:hypothetical protein